MLVVYEQHCHAWIMNHKATLASAVTANNKAMPVVYQRPCHDYKAMPDSATTANDEAMPVVY